MLRRLLQQQRPLALQGRRCLLSGGVPQMHGTTILCVRKDGNTVLIGDGQVSQGSMVIKPNAKKVRRIGDGVLVGFAGSTADAFTLLERLEERLEEHPGQLTRACVDLAKAWRTDKYLRRLEAVLLVCDANVSFEITGNGDVLEPKEVFPGCGVMGVGSGGPYALGESPNWRVQAPLLVVRRSVPACLSEDSAHPLPPHTTHPSRVPLSPAAAARALADQPDLDAEAIATKAMQVAADICVYTNHEFIIEKLSQDGADGDDGAAEVTK